MKKVLSIVAIALVAVTFASCEKSYTCECTVSTTGTDPITGMSINSSQVVSETKDAKKADAEDWCAEGNSTQTTLGLTVTSACELK
jgi:hypothetical protein